MNESKKITHEQLMAMPVQERIKYLRDARSRGESLISNPYPPPEERPRYED